MGCREASSGLGLTVWRVAVSHSVAEPRLLVERGEVTLQLIAIWGAAAPRLSDSDWTPSGTGGRGLIITPERAPAMPITRRRRPLPRFVQPVFTPEPLNICRDYRTTATIEGRQQQSVCYRLPAAGTGAGSGRAKASAHPRRPSGTEQCGAGFLRW
jgi:hypothetical protein